LISASCFYAGPGCLTLKAFGLLCEKRHYFRKTG
jgi:hypothetical protein